MLYVMYVYLDVLDVVCHVRVLNKETPGPIFAQSLFLL